MKNECRYSKSMMIAVQDEARDVTIGKTRKILKKIKKKFNPKCNRNILEGFKLEWFNYICILKSSFDLHS